MKRPWSEVDVDAGDHSPPEEEEDEGSSSGAEGASDDPPSPSGGVSYPTSLVPPPPSATPDLLSQPHDQAPASTQKRRPQIHHSPFDQYEVAPPPPASKATRRSKEGHRRPNGKWEARFRPKSKVKLDLAGEEEFFPDPYRGFDPIKQVHKYEWLSYFDTKAQKDQFIAEKRMLFKAAVNRLKIDEVKSKSPGVGSSRVSGGSGAGGGVGGGGGSMILAAAAASLSAASSSPGAAESSGRKRSKTANQLLMNDSWRSKHIAEILISLKNSQPDTAVCELHLQSHEAASPAAAALSSLLC